MSCTCHSFRVYVSYVACPLLSAPANGNIDCSLGDDNIPTARDSCTFTCDDGFRLGGSPSRVCQIRHGRARWNGRQTTCSGGNNWIWLVSAFAVMNLE